MEMWYASLAPPALQDFPLPDVEIEINIAVENTHPNTTSTCTMEILADDNGYPGRVIARHAIAINFP
jgi:hypothetical protein